MIRSLFTFALTAARGLLGGGRFGIRDIVGSISDAYIRLEQTESEVEKAKIRAEIEQMKAVHDLQKHSSRRFLSPMMIGQYLIVVPFGLWWASIYLVSILGTNFPIRFEVQAVPPQIMAMSEWLVPLIVIGTFIDSKTR